MAVLFLYLVSGFAGLVLEAVFLRQLSLIVGSAATATVVVLAVFMGGLALGAALFGSAADRSGRPLRLYGWLEIGAGCTGLALCWLFGPGRLALLTVASDSRAQALLTGLLLLVPTALMGGTLPALSRFAVKRRDLLVGPVGLLYGINTLGGAAGVLCAGFLLFERVGVAASGYLACLLDILVGIGAILLARALAAKALLPEVDAAVPRDIGRARDGIARVCTIACGVGGAAMLGYEIVWTRLLCLPLRSFSYSFSVMLSLFLLGLVLGSLAIAALSRSVRDPVPLFGWTLVGMGGVAAGILPWLPQLLVPSPASSLEGALLASAARAAVLVLPATILSGMALPLAARAVAPGRSVGFAVGGTVAANTLGGIVGAFASSLGLLPAFGTSRALSVLACAVAASGAAVLFVARARRASLACAVAVAVLCAATLLLPRERVLAAFLSASRGRDRTAEILYFHEGKTNTVAIVRKDYGFYDPDAKSLLTNGIAMSATVAPVRRYMAVEGHLPVLLAPDPRRVLVIGIGTGITLAAVASEERAESITAVELSEGVLRGLRFFEDELRGADRDPRVRIVHEDGRHFLESSDARFGAITLEPPPPIVAGSTHLYSLDFYELARRRLEPGGVVAQWLPLHAQSLLSARMTARTFLDAFPYVQMWLPSIRDAVLVGSERPLMLDLDRLRAAYASTRSRSALVRAYLETPEALLGTFLADRDWIERWAGVVPPITDDRPRMEFFRTLGANMTDREIATLEDAPEPSLAFVRGLPEDLRGRIAEEHRALRLYLRSETEENVAAGLEAARRSTGTEFFRYRLGCADRQLDFIGGRLAARAAEPGLAAQVERCRGWGFEPRGTGEVKVDGRPR